MFWVVKGWLWSFLPCKIDQHRWQAGANFIQGLRKYVRSWTSKSSSENKIIWTSWTSNETLKTKSDCSLSLSFWPLERANGAVAGNFIDSYVYPTHYAEQAELQKTTGGDLLHLLKGSAKKQANWPGAEPNLEFPQSPPVHHLKYHVLPSIYPLKLPSFLDI